MIRTRHLLAALRMAIEKRLEALDQMDAEDIAYIAALFDVISLIVASQANSDDIDDELNALCGVD